MDCTARRFSRSTGLVTAAVTSVVWLLGGCSSSGELPATTSTFRSTSGTAHAGSKVTATITVGGGLQGAAIDPALGTLYVGDSGGPGDGRIAVIDTWTRAVTKNIAIDQPLDVAVDTGTHTIYVAGSSWGRNPGVSAVDPATGAIRAITSHSGQIAIDSADHTAYVEEGDVGTPSQVSVIDLASDTVTKTIQCGGAKAPVAVAVNPSSHLAYCANLAGSISVVDHTGALKETFDVGTGSAGIAIDPTGHTAYVTRSRGSYDPGSVSVVDLATRRVTATIEVGKNPSGIALDPANHLAYVANTQSGTVSIIDSTTGKPRATVTVGMNPTCIAIDPNTHLAYVVNGIGGTVSVISPSPPL